MFALQSIISPAARAAALQGLAIGAFHATVGTMANIDAVLVPIALASPPTENAEPPKPGVREREPVPPPDSPALKTPEGRVQAGWSSRPLGAGELTGNVPDNTIHMFKDAEFKDDANQIDNVTTKTPGGAHDVPGAMGDDLSSLRWNLPPGVVVVLYEDGGGRGEQVTVWGKGEMSSLSRWNANDKVSSWAWYYAGGDPSASAEVQRGFDEHPRSTESTSATIASRSLQLFKDKNFKDDMISVNDVTSEHAGSLNKVPGEVNDKITSLRWNLPPGVVVVFYQDAQGEKQQAAVWGAGEIKDIDVLDFNDKLSRWAWYYIGTKDVTPPERKPPHDDEDKRGAKE